MTDRTRRLGPLFLRLMVGVGFIIHGLPKLTPEGHESFARTLQVINVPSPEVMAWVVGGLEVLGGAMLIAGILVRVVTIPLIVEMVVAMIKVHWPQGFNASNITGIGPDGPTFGLPGIELNLLYISILIALWFLGAGRFSIDEYRRRPAHTEPYLIRHTREHERQLVET